MVDEKWIVGVVVLKEFLNRFLSLKVEMKMQMISTSILDQLISTYKCIDVLHALP